MNLPFNELKVFWNYINAESRGVLIRSAKASTEQGTKEWQRIKDTVCDYDVKGPMGSMDPTLPIDLKDLESKILREDSTLRECWKKKTSTSGPKVKASKPKFTSLQNGRPPLWLGRDCLGKSAFRVQQGGRK